MPPNQELVDMELHAGEFLELNDLLAPAVDNEGDENIDADMGSDLTLAINLPGEEASSNNSIQGPAQENQLLVAPVVAPLLLHHFLDLNIPAPNLDKETEAGTSGTTHFPITGPSPSLDDMFPFSVEEQVLASHMVTSDDVEQQVKEDVSAGYQMLNVNLMSELVLATENDSNVVIGSRIVPYNMDNTPAQDSLVGGSVLEELDAPPDMVEPVLQRILDSCDISDSEFLGVEGALLWKENCSPSADNDKTVQVPIEWVNFFTATLLSPDKFEWDKGFLASQFWKYIVEGADNDVWKVIPENRSSSQGPTCKEAAAQAQGTPDKSQEASMLASSTSAMHANRKRKDKGPLVETEVRRSTRLLHKKNGFKKITCMERNYISRNSRPPIIPAKIVKNLNVSFYKVDPMECSEEALLRQEKKKQKHLEGDKSQKSREEPGQEE
ncbi:unnamed protein product [Alopecurus aequalis]